MRQLDTEILSEEARVGDFKRRVTKQFMLLKFGGLLEFAEKATVSTGLAFSESPLATTDLLLRSSDCRGTWETNY
jgi:hypothetical protein